MSTYKAPLDDLRFALYDVLGAEALFRQLGFEDANRELVDAVLDEAARFTETVLAPLNRIGDEVGCKYDKASGDVTPPPGFKDAFDKFVEGGWTGLTNAPEHGGQGMPAMLGGVLTEMVDSANLAWGNFPMLSHGAVKALEVYGEPWQQEVFLKPLVEGRWTGTMCLTEPHCGTDLGIIKTRAVPNADGSHAISGTKIFITGGEQDLTENIIHLVLAKLPDAPAGSRGISLFLVPKFLVGDDGALGARNAVHCGSIEHKMGIKASATCVMNFDGATGWLVGEANKGLAAMFTMMNYERLGVGLQGLGIAERAFQGALGYARERLQSRALVGPQAPDKVADPIIVHPDVRRMLLTQKTLVEGCRMLSLHAYSLLDVAEHAKDPAERERAETLVSFLTPISKACQTEWGIENTYNALQCFGGHGYIAEHGMEQLARDARISMLYEGTTGIQALDLLGRKTAATQGAGLKLFIAEVEAFAKQHEGDEALAEFIAPLRAKCAEWGKLTIDTLTRAAANPEELGAASTDYLFYSGYVVLAYWWARSVAAAAGSSRSQVFKDAKRDTARFYFARILPRTLAHKAAIEAGAGPLMAMAAEAFGD